MSTLVVEMVETPALSLLDFALEGSFVHSVEAAIRDAAAFIRQEHESFTRDKAELKGPSDLVSYVDRGSEAMLRERFITLLPGSGFIMEESGYDHPEHEFVWIVDPLDGTTNFVFGIPIYSISVAMRRGGQTLLGFVFDINRQEMFSAGLGQGALLNGKPIHSSRVSLLGESLIATGFPFSNFKQLDQYMLMLKDMMTHTRGMRRLGSAALDLAYVAAGRFDGFFESGLSPWDVAAGALLVQEAGGNVTDFHGESDFIFGKMILAAGPLIHPALYQMITQYASR